MYLISDYPELLGELNAKEDVKNINFRCKVEWQCNLGHFWQATLHQRIKNKVGCPICLNKKVLDGFNDFLTTEPKLAVFWNYSKNTILPNSIKSNYSKKVWWLCDNKHEWQASVYDITRNDGKNTWCPYCVNKKIITGYNDFYTLEPVFAKEWNYEKNKILPTEVASKSGKSIWWRCNQQHEWQAKISNRVTYNLKCPYCSNQKVLKGYNDLATLAPDIAKEWNYDKNKALSPCEVTFGSNKKVWWICRKGHEWIASVGDRKTGYNCLKCSSSFSKKEQQLKDLIVGLGFDIEENNKSIIGKELDIFIPKLKVAFEFNGLYWHTQDKLKDSLYHFNKWKMCKEKGIQLYQIWEDDWDKFRHNIKSQINSLLLGEEAKSNNFTIEDNKDILIICANGSIAGVAEYSLDNHKETILLKNIKLFSHRKKVLELIIQFATSKNTKIVYVIDDLSFSLEELLLFFGFVQKSINAPSRTFLIDKKRVQFKDNISADIIWDSGTILFEKEVFVKNEV